MFIRKWRAPLTILASIVFSLLLAVMVLFVLGYTLNMFTLAALTIAIGMLVDNAIVVYEHLQKNLPNSREERIEYVSSSLPHVIVPILANTLTTIGIFLPLLYSIDSLRYFLEPLGLTLSITLVASVIISLTWIPYVIIWFTADHNNQNKKIKSQASQVSFVENFRIKIRKWVLWWFYFRQKIRWLLLVVLLLSFGIPLYIIPSPSLEVVTQVAEIKKTDNVSVSTQLKRVHVLYESYRHIFEPWLGGFSYHFIKNTDFGEGFSENDEERNLTIFIRTPIGSPLEEIDKIVKGFEDIGQRYAQELEYMEAKISEFFGAHIIYRFKEGASFRKEPYRLYGEASYLAIRTGNTGISVNGFGEGFSTSLDFAPLITFRLDLRGYSDTQLKEIALELKQRLLKNSKVKSVNINLSEFYNRNDMYRYVMRFDDWALSEKKLNRRLLVNHLQPEINSENILTKTDFEGRQVYLMTMVDLGIKAESDLMYRPRFISDQILQLNDVATFTKEPIKSRIDKKNQEYTRTVGIEYLGMTEDGNEFLQEVISTLPLPPGISLTIPRGMVFGNQIIDKKAIWWFMLAAPFIIWLISAALLESWKDALVVVLIIPSSLIGLMAITLYNEITFGQSGWSAALLLTGIAVNNGILLIHHSYKYDKEGVFGIRKWFYVYKDKSRAVALTTITTIAGLLPMIIWQSNSFWYELASFVIWGLVISTLIIMLLMGSWEKSSV